MIKIMREIEIRTGRKKLVEKYTKKNSFKQNIKSKNRPRTCIRGCRRGKDIYIYASYSVWLISMDAHIVR